MESQEFHNISAVIVEVIWEAPALLSEGGISGGLVGSGIPPLHPAVMRYSPFPGCQRRLSGDPELPLAPKSNEVELLFPLLL